MTGSVLFWVFLALCFAAGISVMVVARKAFMDGEKKK